MKNTNSKYTKTKSKKQLSRCKRDLVRNFILSRGKIDYNKESLASEIGVTRPTLWKYLKELIGEDRIQYLTDDDWGFGAGKGKIIIVKGQ